MNTTRARIRWARKVLNAKSFIVVTNKEFALMVDAIDPNEITDRLILATQAAELEQFRDELDKLIKQHTDILEANKPRSKK